MFRDIEVDDKRDVLDVDASCRNVSCNKDAISTVSKSFECLSSLCEGAVGMDFSGVVAVVSSKFCDFACAVTCSGENEDGTFVLVKQLFKDLMLLLVFGTDDFLLNSLGGCSLGSNLDSSRVDHVPVCNVFHFW